MIKNNENKKTSEYGRVRYIMTQIVIPRICYLQDGFNLCRRFYHSNLREITYHQKSLCHFFLKNEEVGGFHPLREYSRSQYHLVELRRTCRSSIFNLDLNLLLIHR